MKIPGYSFILLVASVVFLNGCNSPYKKEISWAVYDQDLLIAVEVDGYNGDKIKAGTYSVNVDSATKGNGKGPETFDIYVLDHEPRNKYELDNYNPAYSVGGYMNAPIAITVQKGNYLYIHPYDVLYTPTGILKMKYIKDKE